MQAVIEAGYRRSEELVIINHFQCHQQVVHVSDVLDAGGRCLDKKYLSRQRDKELWSTLIFPIKKPPQGHLRLWKEVLLAIAPQGRLQNKIGCFLTRGHKIWEWRYDEESQQVDHHKGCSMDVYTPSLMPRYARRPNFWTRLRIGVPNKEIGEICTVKDVALGVISVSSHTP